MPPPPLFKSPRTQSVVITALTGVFLLGAAGLAKLQAGDGPAYLNTPVDRVQKMPEPEPAGQQHTVLIDTPASWQATEDEPGRHVSIDPEKPTRSITLLTLSAREQANPALAARQFLEQRLDDTARQTFTPISEPLVLAMKETGLSGVQFIGRSTDTEGRIRLHLLACLTIGGRVYWWVYLTDTLDPGEDEIEALRSNVRLLQSVYRSARIETASP